LSFCKRLRKEEFEYLYNKKLGGKNMSAYNHVTLVGNLIKDPESIKIGKKTKSSFTIAVERYTGKDKEPEVDFFNIITWGKLADVVTEFLQKGKKFLSTEESKLGHMKTMVNVNGLLKLLQKT
jgi:hypothetical protein